MPFLKFLQLSVGVSQLPSCALGVCHRVIGHSSTKSKQVQCHKLYHELSVNFTLWRLGDNQSFLGGGYDLNVVKVKSCYKVVSTFGRLIMFSWGGANFRLIVFVFLGWGRLQIDRFCFLGVGQAFVFFLTFFIFLTSYTCLVWGSGGGRCLFLEFCSLCCQAPSFLPSTPAPVHVPFTVISAVCTL